MPRKKSYSYNYYKRVHTPAQSERQELKRLAVLLALIISLLFFIYLFSTKFLPSLSFLLDLSSPNIATNNDKIPPSPPFVANLPAYTNKDKINIDGFAEPGAQVKLFVNDQETQQSLSDKSGKFTFQNIALKTGENTIYATAKDKAGNESQKSQTLKIVLDKEPPDLEVSSPVEGQIFKDSENKVAVEGRTERGATVKINDEIYAAVRADGTFSASMFLTEPGEKTIKIEAFDRAGNSKTVEVNVTYEKTAEEKTSP